MDKIKELFKGKKGKWLLIGGAGVAVVAGFMVKRSAPNDASLMSYPTAKLSSGGSGGSGSVAGGDGADVAGALMRGLEQSMKEQSEKFDETLLSTQNAYNQMFAAYSNSTQQQIAGLQGQLAGQLLNTAQAKMNAQSQAPVYYDTSIYSYDTSVYSSDNPYSDNAALGNAPMPIYGYGGADYYSSSREVQKSIEANEERLSSDYSFVESERTRTEKVISNREGAGLDTSEQRTYQDKLDNIKASDYLPPGFGGGWNPYH